MIDFHNYARRFENAKNKVLDSETLSQRNKDIIMKFHEHIILQGIGYPRIIKYFEKLRYLASVLNKDFDTATRADIEKVIVSIHQRPDLKTTTKIDYSVITKRFYKYLLGNDEEFPEQVKWIKANMKTKDKLVPSQADLITEEEVQRLLNVADHPRNKALVSLLYETGCRIGELANLSIGNILFDQYGCVLNVNGKTGPRRIRVVNSTSYLTTWLDMHPYKNKREEAVWIVNNNRKQIHQIRYTGIRKILQELFKKAGINKRCNPHIFRHSRATFMANHMTEAQMKQYFGWVQASDMASTYVHMSGRDTDNAILEINGLAKKKSQEMILQPKKCIRCGFLNANTSNYCNKCSGVLDVETAVQLFNGNTNAR